MISEFSEEEETEEDPGAPETVPDLEAADDAAEDGRPATEAVIPDDPDASEPQEFEEIEAAIGEIRDLEDADASAVEEPDEPEIEAVEDLPEAILGIDESSVGAWSTTMRAAGVSGEEAWTEPTDELMVGEAEVSAEASWIEPTTTVDAAAVLPEPPFEAADGDPSEEAGPAELAPQPAGVDLEEAVEPSDSEAVAAATEAEDEVPPQVEIETFESMEVTHTAVVEQRLANAEAGAGTETDAENEAQLEADSEIEVERPMMKAVEVETVEVAVEDSPGAADGEDSLPGEDRGVEAVAVTQPVALAPAADDEGAPEPVGKSDSDPDGERLHELAHGVPLPTMTLAKLAMDQDDLPLAMATLESLLERNPSNAEALRLLDELRGQEAEVVQGKLRAMQATAKIAALQGWLDAVRLAAERRLP